MLFRTSPLLATSRDAAALTRLSNRELDAVFRASPAGRVPGGRLAGTALLFPGTLAGRVLARLAHLLVWQGKVTDRSRRSLKNLVGPAGTQAIQARLSHDRSWVDGRKCLLIDYSQTSTVAHMVRDEVRLVAPGLYLGVVWLWRRRVAWFVLRSAG